MFSCFCFIAAYEVVYLAKVAVAVTWLAGLVSDQTEKP
jgi:hypothetical protein